MSSGILNSPDYTMELLYQTLRKLRTEYHFGGYIHVKAIPGADPALIEKTGFLADRMSVNLELPTAEGLRRLAPARRGRRFCGPCARFRTGWRRTGMNLLCTAARPALFRQDSLPR